MGMVCNAFGKLRNRHLLFILGVLLIICVLPPITLFSDEWLLPKWYGTGMLLVFSIILWAICKKDSIYKYRIKAYQLCWLVLIITVAECLYAYSLMLIGQSNFDYGLQGSFDNPAALALHLCILLPFTINLLLGGQISSTVKTALIIAGVVLAVTTISLTRSRTGLICMIMMFIVDLCVSWRGRAISKAIIISCLVIGACCFCLVNKTQSSLGRKFILENSWTLIKEHPIKGYGVGKFHKEYMIKQSEFFKNNYESRYSMLADDIHHPLNEFLYLWIDFGIMGPIILLILLITPIAYCLRTKGFLWLKIVISILIFSLFSYPLYYPLTWLFLLGINYYVFYNLVYKRFFLAKKVSVICQTKNFKYLVLGVGLVSFVILLSNGYYEYCFGKTERRAIKGHSKEMLKDYQMLVGHFRDNPYFLYSYMSSQYRAGNFVGVVTTYNSLSEIDAGYDMELLMGDTYRQMGKYENADIHYKTATYMCPCRFAPFEGLLLSYQFQGKTDSADSLAKLIINKDIKIPSPIISYIKCEAKDWLDREDRFI